MLLSKLISLYNSDTVLVLEQPVQSDYHYFFVVWVCNLGVIEMSYDKACHFFSKCFFG